GDLHRVDRVHDHALRPGPRRQPGVVAPADDDEDRRRVVELVLHLPGQAEAAGRRRLPVEDRQVDASRVAGADHFAAGRDLDDLDLEVGRRTRTQRAADAVADPRHTRVDKQRDTAYAVGGGLGGGVGHGRDLTVRSDTAADASGLVLQV